MAHTLESALHADLASIDSTARDMRSANPVMAAASEAAPQTTSFIDSMASALHRVDAGERRAGDLMSAVDSGRSDDLVGAMLASQEASLSFSMLMQVRNKVMGAVEDLVKLPL